MPPYYALTFIIKHTGEAANGLTVVEANALYDPPWTALPLGPSFAAAGGVYGAPSYRKVGRMIELSGMANSTAAFVDGVVVGTLPAGALPAFSSNHQQYVDDVPHNNIGTIQARADGTIVLYAGSLPSGRVVSLDGIRFAGA
jgi:hypothetical protein